MGEGGIGCQFPESYIDSYISDLSPVFLREEPVLFDCLFKNTGFYDLTNNLLKQSCICTLSFQQINTTMKILKIKLEYWLPGITIGDSGARLPVVISNGKIANSYFLCSIIS